MGVAPFVRRNGAVDVGEVLFAGILFWILESGISHGPARAGLLGREYA